MSLSERATAARCRIRACSSRMARDGDERVVEILLEADADAGLRNKSRQNARDIARAAGRTAIAEMMK